MKSPAIPYPNSAIQHTRAVISLTVLIALNNMYMAPPKSPIAAHMLKIANSVESCTQKTKTRKLSQGAKRALDAACLELAPYIEFDDKLDKDLLFTRWASIVYCALTFVEDVLNTCPEYRKPPEGIRWRALYKKILALTDSLIELEPGIDESGTALYEVMAWAMEGKEADPEPRQLLLERLGNSV